MKYHVSFGIFVVLYETMSSRLTGHIQRKLDNQQLARVLDKESVTFFGHVKLTYDDYRARHTSILKVALIAIHL